MPVTSTATDNPANAEVARSRRGEVSGAAPRGRPETMLRRRKSVSVSPTRLEELQEQLAELPESDAELEAEKSSEENEAEALLIVPRRRATERRKHDACTFQTWPVAAGKDELSGLPSFGTTREDS